MRGRTLWALLACAPVCLAAFVTLTLVREQAELVAAEADDAAIAPSTDQVAFVRALVPDARGNLITLETKAERTLFFDFLPLEFGEIRGFKTKFQLYTVPGQVFYDASRKLILKGVDGVVFVADSQAERMDANLESLENLRTNLKEQGYELDNLPYVVQYNKRDLPNAVDLDYLKRYLNPTNVPDYEGVATTGVGVFDTLKAVAKQVLIELKRGR
jgi:signal recognition particle receptor subunit beta